MYNPFKPTPIDSLEEHKIELPGLSIAFNHKLKLVFVIDQTGIEDDYALSELERWVTSQGYFLHCVTVKAQETPDANK